MEKFQIEDFRLQIQKLIPALIRREVQICNLKSQI